MLDDKDVAALREGTFTRDCLTMELISQSRPQPRRFTGPGFFRQSPTRRLEFTIYCVEATDVGTYFDDLVATTAAVLVPDQDFFQLRATDWLGAVWESERIVPDASFGSSGTIVRGFLNAIGTSEEYRGSENFHGIAGRIFSDFEIPANLRTESSETVGGKERRRSAQWRGLKVESYGATLVAHPEPGILTIEARATNALPPRFETRVLETLQFLLARHLQWDTVTRIGNGTCETTIAGRPTPKTASQYWEPLALVHARDQTGTEAFCRLFDAYLRHIIHFTDDRWHPLTVDLNAVSRAAASSLETHVLVLAVAVESILRNAFPDFGQPSRDLLTELDKTLERVDQWALSAELHRRIRGSLGAMKSPRAADQLRDLVRRGLIEDQKRVAWEKLRLQARTGTSF